MYYLNIENVFGRYESLYDYSRIITLEKDSFYGEVIGGYIVCSFGNYFSLAENKDEDEKYWAESLRMGNKVVVVPLSFVHCFSSTNGNLEIEWFEVQARHTTFHPLIGIDRDEECILDMDEDKQTYGDLYYYIKTLFNNLLNDWFLSNSKFIL